MFFNNFFYFLSEFFFLFFLLIIFSYGIFFSSFYFKLNYKPIFLNIFNFFFIFLIFFVIILNFNILNFNFYLFNNIIVSDFSIYFFKNFFIFIFFLFLFILFPFFYNKKIISYEFLILIFFSFFSMYILIGANDFLLIFLCLEMQSLCFYILSSFKRRSFFSTEAGLKYFILGSLSSGFLLFSLSLIFGCTGILNLIDLEYFFYNFNIDFFYFFSDIFLFSLFLLFSSLFFKLSLAPFHNWTLDVFEGSSLIVTSFFIIISKIPIFFLIFKLLFFSFFSFFLDLQFFILICSFLSIIIGTIGALEQNNVKRLFAYLSILSAGFLILGLVVDNFFGIFSSVFYLFISSVLFLNFFSIFLSFFDSKFLMLKNLEDFSIFFKSNYLISFFLMLCFLSLAGLPPLVGFFSKFFILYCLINNSFYFFAIFLLIFSLLNFYVFLKLIKFLFFFQQIEFKFYFDFNFYNLIIFVYTSIFNLFFFFTPNFFINFFINFALYLFL